MLKQVETKLRNVMPIICFVYAGISFIIFLLGLMILIMGGDVIVLNSIIEDLYPEISDIVNQITLFFSIVLTLVSFFGFLVSLLAGIVLYKGKENVVEEVKKEQDGIARDMLLPEEVKIVEILEENDRVMTQADLTKESEFSKVKIHRILKRLEAKKILSKYTYGMTKRIKLEKKLNGKE